METFGSIISRLIIFPSLFKANNCQGVMVNSGRCRKVTSFCKVWGSEMSESHITSQNQKRWLKPKWRHDHMTDYST